MQCQRQQKLEPGEPVVLRLLHSQFMWWQRQWWRWRWRWCQRWRQRWRQRWKCNLLICISHGATVAAVAEPRSRWTRRQSNYYRDDQDDDGVVRDDDIVWRGPERTSWGAQWGAMESKWHWGICNKETQSAPKDSLRPQFKSQSGNDGHVGWGHPELRSSWRAPKDPRFGGSEGHRGHGCLQWQWGLSRVGAVEMCTGVSRVSPLQPAPMRCMLLSRILHTRSLQICRCHCTVSAALPRRSGLTRRARAAAAASAKHFLLLCNAHCSALVADPDAIRLGLNALQSSEI